MRHGPSAVVLSLREAEIGAARRALVSGSSRLPVVLPDSCGEKVSKPPHSLLKLLCVSVWSTDTACARTRMSIWYRVARRQNIGAAGVMSAGLRLRD